MHPHAIVYHFNDGSKADMTEFDASFTDKEVRGLFNLAVNRIQGHAKAGQIECIVLYTNNLLQAKHDTNVRFN